MHHVNAQGSGGAMVGQTDLLMGDLMTRLWGDETGISLAAKKKTAKKPAKKPAKKAAKKPKPRPTRNRPGCETTGKACATH